jgi:hypothetical protein
MATGGRRVRRLGGGPRVRDRVDRDDAGACARRRDDPGGAAAAPGRAGESAPQRPRARHRARRAQARAGARARCDGDPGPGALDRRTVRPEPAPMAALASDDQRGRGHVRDAQCLDARRDDRADDPGELCGRAAVPGPAEAGRGAWLPAGRPGGRGRGTRARMVRRRRGRQGRRPRGAGRSARAGRLGDCAPRSPRRQARAQRRHAGARVGGAGHRVLARCREDGGELRAAEEERLDRAALRAKAREGSAATP